MAGSGGEGCRGGSWKGGGRCGGGGWAGRSKEATR